MPYTMQDLVEVMEDESARGTPPADLLDGVRRRVRRGDRRRAAVGVLGVALAATAFAVVARPDGTGPPPPGDERRALAAAMPGTPNESFRDGPPVEGLRPLKEVRFSQFGRMARVTFTPTEPFTMYTAQCAGGRAFSTTRGTLGSGGCGSTSYLATTPGVPVTIQMTVLPAAAEQRLSHTLVGANAVSVLYRYLNSHPPTPGNWSVRIYTGKCNSTCERMARLSTARRQPPVEGLRRLARVEGTADGRVRPVRLKGSDTSLRMRVTCLDGAATAVVQYGERARVIACEAAESEGVVRDVRIEADTRLMIAVLPAEAKKVRATDGAALREMMKGVRPAGKWTLEVYAR
ncbi:hypothetical protein [Actinomadura chibensis]|uniref:Uncharacterized protein n=1 Tax=Actinomadura chibensis TaxID=392828 RepID=A0A5D0NKZ8_9ACTN|nr:hypothetical protein [Actinomadura chibensis]TYB44928.1 hypothetical protein FXF69_22650 [Actinomadura chibensis]